MSGVGVVGWEARFGVSSVCVSECGRDASGFHNISAAVPVPESAEMKVMWGGFRANSVLNSSRECTRLCDHDSYIRDQSVICII